MIDGFADIHSHLLFEVDDGSPSLEDSLEMLRFARGEGITTMFATPHYGEGNVASPDAAHLRARFELLKTKARDILPEMDLYLGSELFYTPDLLDRLEAGDALSMNGTPYILVEFAQWKGHYDTAEHITGTMLRLAQTKWLPILAHAQRYRDFAGKFELYQRMVDGGVYLQINSYDLHETDTRETKEKARWLAENRLAHFLGTDSHGPIKRSPVMRSGVNYLLANHPDQAYVEALARGNALKLIKGERVEFFQ